MAASASDALLATVDIPPQATAPIPPPPSARQSALGTGLSSPSADILTSLPGIDPGLSKPLTPTRLAATNDNPSPTTTPGATSVGGPVTPDLVTAAGFAPSEADDWASFGNWLTGGEAHDFRTLYGGKPWDGPLSTHPAKQGWSGGVSADGQQTHAFGLFQDQPGTWDEISHRYLGGNQAMTPENQVKGNLHYAADYYHAQTGRSLMADWKAGNKDAIAGVLSPVWSSLKSGTSSSTTPEASDPTLARQQASQRSDLAHLGDTADRIMRQAQAAPAGSDERQQLLHQAMQHSERLMDRFEKLSTTPPKPMSPFEAAGDFTPLLIGLASLGGLFTRRPALGALNALGSALEGLKKGNDQQYQDALTVWSKQTDAASKAFTMQNESIQNIIKDVELTARERQEKLENEFRVWGMTKELALAKSGQMDKAIEQADKHVKLQNDIAESHARISLDNARAVNLKETGGSTNPVQTAYRKAKQVFVAKNGREPSEVEDKKLFDDSLAQTHPGAAAKPVSLDVTQEDGTRKTYTAQQDRSTGQWVTADERKEPIDTSHGYSVSSPSAGKQAETQTTALRGAANEAVASLKNLTELPISATSGAFMGVQYHTPEGLADALKRGIARSFTPQESRDLFITFSGLGRSLATLEAQGRASGLVGLSGQMDRLMPQSGDSPLTVMRDYAEIRQIIERSVESAKVNSRNPDSTKLFDKILEETRDAVPFSVHDINMLQYGANNPKAVRTVAEDVFKRMKGKSKERPAEPSTQAEYDALSPGDYYKEDGVIKQKGAK